MQVIAQAKKGAEVVTRMIDSRDNVTSLTQYRKPMKNPIFIELLDHWEHLRDGRIAPLRSEIDPREIENALEYAFILERTNAGEPRLRIAGMRLCDLAGMEVRGMPATALIAPDSRESFTQILNRSFDAPEIVEVQLISERQHLAPMKAEMLLLPMQSDTGDVSRILGCLVDDGGLVRPPERFDITSHKVTRIIATKTQNQKTPVAGFAEAPGSFVQQPKRPAPRPASHPARNYEATHPYLRLVKNDD